MSWDDAYMQDYLDMFQSISANASFRMLKFFQKSVDTWKFYDSYGFPRWSGVV